MNYFTFEISKKFGKINYETGWWISYPRGNYSRKSLKKIRREVEEQSKINFRPGYVSNTLTLASIDNSSLKKRRKN
jgi:hypothetical protein